MTLPCSLLCTFTIYHHDCHNEHAIIPLLFLLFRIWWRSLRATLQGAGRQTCHLPTHRDRNLPATAGHVKPKSAPSSHASDGSEVRIVRALLATSDDAHKFTQCAPLSMRLISPHWVHHDHSTYLHSALVVSGCRPDAMLEEHEKSDCPYVMMMPDWQQ